MRDPPLSVPPLTLVILKRWGWTRSGIYQVVLQLFVAYCPTPLFSLIFIGQTEGLAGSASTRLHKLQEFFLTHRIQRQLVCEPCYSCHIPCILHPGTNLGDVKLAISAVWSLWGTWSNMQPLHCFCFTLDSSFRFCPRVFLLATGTEDHTTGLHFHFLPKVLTARTQFFLDWVLLLLLGPWWISRHTFFYIPFFYIPEPVLKRLSVLCKVLNEHPLPLRGFFTGLGWWSQVLPCHRSWDCLVAHPPSHRTPKGIVDRADCAQTASISEAAATGDRGPSVRLRLLKPNCEHAAKQCRAPPSSLCLEPIYRLDLHRDKGSRNGRLFKAAKNIFK